VQHPHALTAYAVDLVTLSLHGYGASFVAGAQQSKLILLPPTTGSKMRRPIISQWERGEA